MDKKIFDNIDNIKVPEKTKAELFAKIEEKKAEEMKAESKKRGFFSQSKWLVTGIAIGAICMMFIIPFINGGVDYQQYVSIASEKVAGPYEEMLKEKKALKVKLKNGEITLDEFLKEYDLLQERAVDIDKQRQEINKEYGIDEKNVESSLKKASDKDRKSINSYMTQLEELEREDNRLDELEDSLERDYESGKINRETFVTEMEKLDAKEEQLDEKEDRLENESGRDDEDDDDDDNDDNDEDDDDNEDDDD